MIKYSGGLYGFQALFRLHGSAAFKALPPALLSTAIYVGLFRISVVHEDLLNGDPPIFAHPYPLSALMVAFTFLLTFKASFSYNRYWEAVTAVHQMHSKWLDVGMELASFHLQSKRYVKPPAFGDYPQVKSLQRERLRNNEQTREELEETLDAAEEALLLEEEREEEGRDVGMRRTRNRFQRAWRKLKKRRKKQQRAAQASSASKAMSVEEQEGVLSFRSDRLAAKSIMAKPTSKQQCLPQNFPVETLYESSNLNTTTAMNVTEGTIDTTTNTTKTISETRRRQPPLFLQESAHLLSLLSAVAMSTLRGDLEEAESPLTTFRAGQPWPHVDPDSYSADIRKDWYKSRHRSWTVLNYILGRTRNARAQTLYNAARPFRVVGGVSDAEVELLQAARGPLAKVALCTFWLQEFISREHLAGSTGGIAHPILSRLYQFVSDGMIGYNQARKVAMIPFPFAHAQITTLFIGVVIFILPLLMLTYVNHEVFGAVLNFWTVMCFTGLHEVSRELEDPFQNVPNDIPLNNFQAQFNEALMTMFSGYHPDAFWKVCIVQTTTMVVPPTTSTPSVAGANNTAGEDQSATTGRPKHHRKTSSVSNLFANLVDRVVRENNNNNNNNSNQGSVASSAERKEETEVLLGETHLAVVSGGSRPSTSSSNTNNNNKGHRRDTSKVSSVVVAEIPLDELDEHLSVMTGGGSSSLSNAYEIKKRVSSIEKIENMELHASKLCRLGSSDIVDDDELEEEDIWLHHPSEEQIMVDAPAAAAPKSLSPLPPLPPPPPPPLPTTFATAAEVSQVDDDDERVDNTALFMQQMKAQEVHMSPTFRGRKGLESIAEGVRARNGLPEDPSNMLRRSNSDGHHQSRDGIIEEECDEDDEEEEEGD